MIRFGNIESGCGRLVVNTPGCHVLMLGFGNASLFFYICLAQQSHVLRHVKVLALPCICKTMPSGGLAR
jgi:hypothetical protein